MGFGVPLETWMRGLARDRPETVLSAPVMESGLFDAASIQRLLHDVRNGYTRWRVDRSEELFALLVFSAWWNRFGN
jgi:hypothetical protein